MDPKPQELDEINIGSNEAPKKVHIGLNFPTRIRIQPISFLRNYRHVFVWSYDDVKAYREDLFQHVIPLNENVKPFRHKKRPIYPTLAPKMQE